MAEARYLDDFEKQKDWYYHYRDRKMVYYDKVMMIRTFVFLLLGLSCPFTSVKATDQWDYLVFAQFWPPSSCIYLAEHHDTCKIPSNVKDWTIHGLWPSQISHSEEPENCNKSSKFDYDKIKSLGKQLDLFWHFYSADQDPHYLWNHEWVKHGTCAHSLAALRGEMNYFNKTLQLHSQVNLTAVLAASDIVPSSDNSYKREDFFNAVQKFYKVKPFIVCVYDKKTSEASIDQIYMCYDKKFQRQDCYPTKITMSSIFTQTRESSYYQDCAEGQQIFYPPYKRGKAHLDKSLIFRSEKSKH